MPDFSHELRRLSAADLSNGRATFVIKPQELLPDVNIGDLIETDTGVVENWTVNHNVPAALAVRRGSQILTDNRAVRCDWSLHKPYFH